VTRIAVALRRLALALALLVAGALPGAVAQQPSSVNPTASSVKEEQLLSQLRQVDGRISIPDGRAGILIQPAGQGWRAFHQVTLQWVGGISIIGVVAFICAFYAKRGRIRIAKGPSGERITRFNGFERFTHWLTAGTFVVLAISGLNITFGKRLLLPLVGPEAFAAFSQFGKYAHNYLSFPFVLGLVLMLLMWIKDNFPNARDVAWFKSGGGLFGKEHPPAARFNGGQKLIFWIVILGGAAMSVSGYLLLFPFMAGTDIADLQLAAIVHGVVGVVFIAAMLGHIYIGSIGMEGAFDAMGSGEVDLNWAKEHHGLWVDEEARKTPALGKTRASAAE
jgi:formate dehydrogenase subunit gamma